MRSSVFCAAVAVVGPFSLDWQTGVSHGQSDMRAAETQMSHFGQAITNHLLLHSKVPNSLQELTKPAAPNPYPFIRSIPQDPWGNDYEYRVIDRTTYTITSYGEDGQPGTEDDIVHPRR